MIKLVVYFLFKKIENKLY